jgi:hypothetical protein
MAKDTHCCECHVKCEPVPAETGKGVVRCPNGACRTTVTLKKINSAHAELRCAACGGGRFDTMRSHLNGRTELNCSHCGKDLIIMVELPKRPSPWRGNIQIPA